MAYFLNPILPRWSMFPHFARVSLIKLLTFYSSDMSLHTKHIIAGREPALPGSWIIVALNEGLAALDRWHLYLLSANHGRKWRGKARMGCENEHAECFGRGDGVFHDSRRVVEWYEMYSGAGRTAIGPGVRSSASPPEERLALEAAVCPGGRSHTSSYWPGSASRLGALHVLHTTLHFKNACFPACLWDINSVSQK